MKKLIALLLALVMVVGVFAACNNTDVDDTKPVDTKPNAGNEDTKPNADTTTEAPESETPLMLPWYSSTEVVTHFQNPQFDSSLMIATEMVWERTTRWNNETSTRIYTIAKSIESNADFTEWTVTFNDGITWHDGEPVTIEDYVFSIYCGMLNPGTGHSSMKLVEGYQDCKDGVTEEMTGLTYDVAANTATIKLTEGNWNFEDTLGGILLLPKHCFEGVEWADIDTADYFKKPIGCGPYMIDQVSMPDFFTLVRYDGYYGAPGGIKNINVVNYNNSAEAMATAMMNGDLDFVNRTAIADAQIADAIVAQNPDVKVVGVAGHGHRCWWFNLGERADGKMKADLQKVEVRQAFDILLDSHAIAELVGATGSGTLLKPDALGYVAEYDRPYDVAAAKALLDKAGFDYTQTYDFAHYYDEQLVHDAHQLIVQLFAAAGVTVNPILLQQPLADAIYTTCNYDIIMVMATASDLLPANNYNQLRSETSYTFMGQHDVRGPLYDELILKYQLEPDAQKRAEIGKEMQKINYENVYAIGGYLTTTYVAWNTANVYIPENAFSFGGSNFQFDQWKMLK